MIITSNVNPQRLQRFFARMTRLSIQIRSGFTLTIGHEQGEVQSAAAGNPDGIQLTQASTTIPYDFWWKGELWHISNAPVSQWALIIVGEANDQPLRQNYNQLQGGVNWK